MLKTPHFFAGQTIDHDDFNRLSQYPKQLSRAMLNTLIPCGGVLNLGNGLRLEILEGNQLCVNEGVALQKNGSLVKLNEKKIFSLSSLDNAKTYYVYLTAKIIGEDPFQEEYDESISGFLSEAEEATVILSEEILPDSLELGRLQPSLSGFALDFNFKNEIEPFFRPLFSPSEKRDLLLAMNSIENSIRKLVRLSWCERDYNVFALLTLLKGELVSAFATQAQMKVYYSDLSQKLLWIFDGVREGLPLKESSERVEAKLEALYLTLPQLEMLEGLSSALPLLNSIATQASELVHEVEDKFQLLSFLEEELRLKEQNYFAFENRILLGGKVLRLVEKIQPENRERVEILAPNFSDRVLDSSFASGEKFQLPGKFISEGVFRVSFQLTVGPKPFVLLLNQYQRRNPIRVEYRLNGEKVSEITGLSFEDRWFRRGIVFPREKMLNGKNILDIEVKECDLDFGFFESALYQVEESGKAS